ncbi:MAG: YbhB/YbcL family Raf kinase inhibitor-like protein [Elusimicrobia bacterium]|nr:YbhB/YbcL family Raf kinase inhibitor-like protein [Elusimicrobiota bacterium]
MRTLSAILALLFSVPAAAGELRHFTIESGGRERHYSVYSPVGAAAGRKLPLILLLHGGGGTGAGMRRLTRGGFEAMADEHGAVIAYPEAVDKHWNDYRGDKSRKSQRENVDDVAFLEEMVRAIEKAYPVDGNRVYAAGISNGAMMSYTLACRAAGRFAAIAAVAGAVPETVYSSCRPSRPVPVLIINGTADGLVHWGGGEVTGPFGKRKFGRAVSVEKSRDLWLALDSCDKTKKTSVRSDSDPEDGTAAVTETYGTCAGGSAVKFVKIEGGGHTWPGGLQYLPTGVIGPTSRELDADAEIWSFFGGHSLEAGAAVLGDRHPPSGKTVMKMESPAFGAGGYIPVRHTCDGDDVSPELRWEGVPSGAAALALIMDDPDAPPGTWVHWVMYGIPPSSEGLPEGVARNAALPDGSGQGLVWGIKEGDFSRVGYYGPCPPPGKPHRYFFKLYALDAAARLPAGGGKYALLDAMKGHVISEAELVGLYARSRAPAGTK